MNTAPIDSKSEPAAQCLSFASSTDRECNISTTVVHMCPELGLGSAAYYFPVCSHKAAAHCLQGTCCPAGFARSDMTLQPVSGVANLGKVHAARAGGLFAHLAQQCAAAPPFLQQMKPPCLQASAALQHAISQQPAASCMLPLQGAIVGQTCSRPSADLRPPGHPGLNLLSCLLLASAARAQVHAVGTAAACRRTAVALSLTSLGTVAMSGTCGAEVTAHLEPVLALPVAALLAQPRRLLNVVLHSVPVSMCNIKPAGRMLVLLARAHTFTRGACCMPTLHCGSICSAGPWCRPCECCTQPLRHITWWQC